MDLREIGCEDGRWMELAQDRVQWRALMLALLNLRVPLPESLLVTSLVRHVFLQSIRHAVSTVNWAVGRSGPLCLSFRAVCHVAAAVMAEWVWSR
jgi:hypothetical protein